MEDWVTWTESDMMVFDILKRQDVQTFDKEKMIEHAYLLVEAFKAQMKRRNEENKNGTN